MNDEQFKANLVSLARKVQEGEIDDLREDKDSESADKNFFSLFLAGNTKPPKRTSVKIEKLDLKKSNERTNQSPVKMEKLDLKKANSLAASNPASVSSPKVEKSARNRKITLEQFGKRTSGQMEKLFSRKSVMQYDSPAGPRTPRNKSKSVKTSDKISGDN